MLNNLREICNHYHATGEDYEMARQIIGSGYRVADLVIAPDSDPYLYRWYVIPHNKTGNVYFHIQVADDPERPLHDHPWANQSVILSGGYTEQYANVDAAGDLLPGHLRWARKGDVIQRPADQAHRLLMALDAPYTMTLFSTGPKIRKWGFWYPAGWVDADDVCKLEGNVSTHAKR